MTLPRLMERASQVPLEHLHRFGHDLRPLLRLAYRRKTVAGNLARAMPDADIEALADGFYTALTEVGMEILRALSMSPDELRERVTFEGVEALERGKALLLLAHHGNLVWALIGLAQYLPVPVAAVYKPPHRQAMRELMVTIAHRFGVTPVPVNELKERLIRERRQRQVLALVADQRPGRRECRTVRLCGRETGFYAGPERIARMFKWPVYYLSCNRLAPGRYHCRIECVAAPPYARNPGVVQRYAELVQADIDRAPADWLWSHDRWRDEPDEA